MKVPQQTRPVIRIPAPIEGKRGLGDAIMNLTSKIGFKPCGGCKRRASLLNKWVGFRPIK